MLRIRKKNWCIGSIRKEVKINQPIFIKMCKGRIYKFINRESLKNTWRAIPSFRLILERIPSALLCSLKCLGENGKSIFIKGSVRENIIQYFYLYLSFLIAYLQTSIQPTTGLFLNQLLTNQVEKICELKGSILEFYQVTLHSKMTMPDSHQNPWTLYLINNVEDTVVFLGLKVFLNFCMFSRTKNVQVTFEKNQSLKSSLNCKYLSKLDQLKIWRLPL